MFSSCVPLVRDGHRSVSASDRERKIKKTEVDVEWTQERVS